jgi:tetrahydromethanopterin S-methyltransferase subunit F
VTLCIVTGIESVCSEQDDMTEINKIVNNVHTSNDSLQRRRVLRSGVNSKESDCSVQGAMMEMTQIMKSVHKSNENLHR